MTEAAYVPKESGEAEGEIPRTSTAPGWLIPLAFVVSIAFCFAGQFLLGKVAENDPAGNHIFYPPPHGQLGDPPEYLEAVKNLMMANNAIGFGILGAVVMAVLGGLLGSAGGQGKLGIGVVAGLIGGAVAGAAAGALGYYLQNTLQQSMMDNLIKTYLVWFPVTLAFALVPTLLAVLTGVAKNVVNAIVTGIIGAGLGTSLYVLLAAFLFIGYPNQLYPEDVGIRQVGYLSLGITAALGITLLTIMDKPKASAQDVDG